MGRPRKNDRHLPPCVYPRHGAFWLVKKGQWTRLGTTLTEALREYALLHEAPAGSMPAHIARVMVHLRRRVPPLAAATLEQYDVAARKLSNALAEFTAEEVRPKHVAQIKRDLVGTPNMANRCLSFLRTVFDQLVEEELVDANPCLGIRRYLEHKRDRLPTFAELAAIYGHSGPRLQVVIDLLIRTGRRVNDVLRIRRADLAEAGIRFQEQKTGAKVIVPWTTELREVVARATALHPNVVALTLLHNRRGKPPDYRTVREQWAKACQAAGVADAHLHDLRAVAATAARQQGKDPTALLAHASAAQTVRYLRDRQEPIAEGPSFGQLLDKRE